MMDGNDDGMRLFPLHPEEAPPTNRRVIDPRFGIFAAIWEQGGGPVFDVRYEMTSDEYQRSFDELVGAGYRLTCVCGYGIGGQDHYAAIWEQVSGPVFAARHGMTSDAYQQAFDQFVSAGYRLTWVSGYNIGGQDCYAAIWEQDGGPIFAARHGMTSVEYDVTHVEFVIAGYRPRLVNAFEPV